MHKDRLIRSSRFVVRAAVITNRLFFLAVAVGLVGSWLLSAHRAGLIRQQTPGIDVPSTITGLRWMMLLGVAMAVPTSILLDALMQIIATAESGDPFIAANARRLQTIAWSLLALQLLDFPGALLEKFFPSLGSGAPGVSFSPGGWLAVMLFVLSRVFAAGSTMRDELEGTV